MNQAILLITLFLSFATSSVWATPIACLNSGVNYSNNPLVKRLNSRLADPAYRVIFLSRHGKSSSKNKFSAEARRKSKKKRKKDVKRPLAGKGRRDASRLAHLISFLKFRDTRIGIWGSYAKRVQDTAKPVLKVLGNRAKKGKEFSKDLYYANVPKEMQQRLVDGSGQKLPYHMFFGHGKTTMALFERLTGVTESFLPTSAMVVVVIKSETWKEVFEGNPTQIEAYAWSPNRTHKTSGGRTEVHGLEGASLESIAMEAVTSPHRASNQGLDLFVVR